MTKPGKIARYGSTEDRGREGNGIERRDVYLPAIGGVSERRVPKFLGSPLWKLEAEAEN